jgi:hypothetical protein
VFRLFDRVSKTSAFDVFGGIFAAIGINILTSILFVEASKSHCFPKLLGFGLVGSGVLVSLGRIYLGNFRRLSEKTASVLNKPFQEVLANAYKRHNSKINVALVLFVIGILVAMGLLVAFFYATAATV